MLYLTKYLFSKTSVLVKFSSTMYTVTEGIDSKVTITVLANGAVDGASFSVRVIAKDGTATSGHIHTCTVFAYTTAQVVYMYICGHIT